MVNLLVKVIVTIVLVAVGVVIATAFLSNVQPSSGTTALAAYVGGVLHMTPSWEPLGQVHVAPTTPLSRSERLEQQEIRRALLHEKTRLKTTGPTERPPSQLTPVLKFTFAPGVPTPPPQPFITFGPAVPTPPPTFTVLPPVVTFTTIPRP